MLSRALQVIPGAAPLYWFLWRKFVLGRGREAFLRGLPAQAKILDVGCGNNSPKYTKQILPHCVYTGLDVGDYNQAEPAWADEYILTSPDAFADRIASYQHAFDAVISNHNLEHCNDREQVLLAMLGALRPGGRIYLAFPCEESVNFPKRDGSLNYYDDATHQGAPPAYADVLDCIEKAGCRIEFASKNYQPIVHYLTGWCNERKSRAEGRTLAGTWAYYGFESVIHGRRPLD